MPVLHTMKINRFLAIFVVLFSAYDLEFPASSCDHLYSNGVFFNSTYIIKDENVTTKQTCGFAGNYSIKAPAFTPYIFYYITVLCCNRMSFNQISIKLRSLSSSRKKTRLYKTKMSPIWRKTPNI